MSEYPHGSSSLPLRRSQVARGAALGGAPQPKRWGRAPFEHSEVGHRLVHGGPSGLRAPSSRAEPLLFADSSVVHPSLALPRSHSVQYMFTMLWPRNAITRPPYSDAFTLTCCSTTSTSLGGTSTWAHSPKLDTCSQTLSLRHLATRTNGVSVPWTIRVVNVGSFSSCQSARVSGVLMHMAVTNSTTPTLDSGPATKLLTFLSSFTCAANIPGPDSTTLSNGAWNVPPV